MADWGYSIPNESRTKVTEIIRTWVTLSLRRGCPVGHENAAKMRKEGDRGLAQGAFGSENPWSRAYSNIDTSKCAMNTDVRVRMPPAKRIVSLLKAPANAASDPTT